MRKLAALASALALAAGGFLAGRLLPGASAAAPAAGRKVLHYACPMHPAVRSDRPGTAPCCGMALEPVLEGGRGDAAAAHPAGTVTMSAGLRQVQGVRVGTVERTSAAQTLRLLGRVAADEARVHVLNAAMEGAVHDVAPVTTGASVRRGQRLAGVFMADLRQALQAYMTALDVIDLDPARLADTGQVVAAGSTPARNALYVVERLRSLGVSDEQLREIKRRREIPTVIDVRAPADGVLLARGVTAGQKFEKGMEWFRIASLDRVWIAADLPEGDAALARPGATARVTVPGRAEPITATVSRVPPIFDPATRTLKLRLELDNPGGALRPDMYADVELAASRPEAVVVPVDAVVDAGVRKTVFVEAGDGAFEPRAVETGWRAGGLVEVVGGLEAGERIVLSGVFLVDSESQLRAVAQAAPPAPAAPRAARAGRAEDPVCHMEVEQAAARAAGRTAEHAGRTWYFCSDGCRARFAADPAKGAAADRHDHAPAARLAASDAGSRP